ncbi:methylthioribulose 1-phosphate dehydratase [Woodsholea maritima]|uniref:methylthioribulose 1-phosphate dehydratase n=1 Tax=Woodsholea maritima TaxID=240237 RepID=UPI00036D49BB|nr:methylthioribulose 1-phosphate dehydratase [Woodsholea maritima]
MSQTLPDFARAADAICEAGRLLDGRGMAPASSGNYSMRLDDGSLALTVSGHHKGRLEPDMIMRVSMDGTPLEAKTPSAETRLHCQIYDLCPEANAILHVHSRAGAVLSRVVDGDIVLEGYEMLKAFRGIDTHDSRVTLPVVPNSQDMGVLSADVAKVLNPRLPYIIRDHGFYAWGASMKETLIICEALDYLLSCELDVMQLKALTRRS